ncbi:uncharacterized protein C3orf38 homolog [Drosophila sulfurigaster albostrigata]|uniref:uncharacterized protein C3orf38 homolog n=1 Tax=Drosophila sulfurigaster albostrigata TaxID=89887 RepID=UPI002D219DBC|nr:uncharacterized protein C3orf38 homolog [Drosophila sulfurigaster albostrigata]
MSITSSISEAHCAGLRDLLVNEKNTPVLLQLARSITKNVCTIEDAEEALGYVTAHLEDIHKVLHKRHITRDLLFKYLHTRLPGTSTDFTKADLVMRVIQYWDKQITTESVAKQTSITTIERIELTEQDYPINLMARKFGEWFFEKFNANDLNQSDLWSDSVLQLSVIADDGTSDVECSTAEEVIASLFSAKDQFGFYFNPNLTHTGVQGRIDVYGHVVVLCCGTLHTGDRSVGVFECAFGLLRDPNADNNWKPKKFKWSLRSELTPPELHTLNSSESLQTALALPTPNDTLD